MPDLALAVSIDGTAGLDFTEAAGYYPIALGPGAHNWIRQTITAPNLDDEYEVSRKRGPMSITFVCLVMASSGPQLATRLLDAIEAVEQVTYNLTAVIDGVTWTWACRGADTSIGDAGSLDARRLANRQQILTAVIPRSPKPVAGPA